MPPEPQQYNNSARKDASTETQGDRLAVNLDNQQRSLPKCSQVSRGTGDQPKVRGRAMSDFPRCLSATISDAQRQLLLLALAKDKPPPVHNIYLGIHVPCFFLIRPTELKRLVVSLLGHHSEEMTSNTPQKPALCHSSQSNHVRIGRSFAERSVRSSFRFGVGCAVGY